MASTDLIQLRQNADNKNDIRVNGDYNINLQQKIVVNPGDQLAVQQSFIDTSTTNSGTINIPEDCTLTIHNGLYIMDVLTQPGLFRNLDDTVRADGDFTGEPFIACYRSDPGEEVAVVNQVTLTCKTIIYPREPSPPKVTGKVVYKYIDPAVGLVRTESYDYSFGEVDGKETKTFPIGRNIAYREGSMIVTVSGDYMFGGEQNTSVSYKDTNTGKISPFPGLVEDPGAEFTPFEFETDIVIPAQKYSPQDLVSTINTLLQKNTPNNQRLVNSTFLATTSTDNPAKLQEVGVDPADQKEVFFINKDATKIFKIDGNTAQFYVGTNNVAFGWEPTQEVFTFDYIHFPYINNADGSDAIALIKTTNIADNNTAGDYVLATKYGGIFFTGFSDNLNNTSLIYDLMNFQGGEGTDSILAQIGRTSFTIGASTGKAPTFNFVEGVNVTTQLCSLDSFVDKKQGANFFEPPVDNNNKIKRDFFSQAPYTVQILANSSVIKSADTKGYFLVEIQAQYSGGQVYTEGSGTLKFIRQVVGRYFTQDSYTTGETGQIVYTHTSDQPLIINSFRVRILDPTLKLADNLGQGTTVFLAHVKNGGASKF